MKKNIFKVLKNLFFLALGLAILWLVTKDLPIDHLYDQLKHTNYFWIVLSLVPGVFSHLFRAIRWNLLIEPLNYKPKTSTTFYAVMIGYLANLAIPRIGEITRCGVLSKKGKIPINSLIGTVILERTIDLLVLLVIITSVILFQFDLVGDWISKHVNLPFSDKISSGYNQVIFYVLIFVAIIVFCYYTFRFVVREMNQHTYFYKVKRFYIGFINGMKSIGKLRSRWLFLLHTLLIWVMYATMIYIPFFAMTETSSLDFIDAITIMAIGSLGIVAPTPGGIGTYHAIVIGILTGIYQINRDVSVIFAYVVHAAQTAMIILVGTISYVALFFQKNN